MDKFNYRIIDPAGRPVMKAPETCRYDKKTEQSLQAAGYTIMLNGKKVTKKEVNNR